MAEGYTKLFSGIVMSTVWTYDSDTRVVWVTLLALADERGVIVGTIPGLAKVAGVSLEATRKAMDIFLSPDPDSGSKEFDGRRIETIDRGWRLLNYLKFNAVDDRRYYGPGWKSARAAALSRDGFRCRSCGAGEPLDVHHIRPMRLFDGDLDAAHKLDNLLSLCRPCHAEADVEIRRSEVS